MVPAIDIVLLVGILSLVLWVLVLAVVAYLGMGANGHTVSGGYPTSDETGFDYEDWRSGRWVQTDGGHTTTVCPACGTENERHYSFCRQCVFRLRRV